jgi:exosome complex RNA-binding protein Rrp4
MSCKLELLRKCANLHAVLWSVIGRMYETFERNNFDFCKIGDCISAQARDIDKRNKVVCPELVPFQPI